MFGRDTRSVVNPRIEIDLNDGWSQYRHALELIGNADWSRALVLLAEAETSFSALDEHQGVWRALIGQALLHWREGSPALAIARAMAALRAAEAADDGFAVGCVAWQIANMMLGQGEYRRAADFLDHAQLALDAVGMAPPGGALAAAAQLCAEIVRWQQMYERKQLGQREAEAAIAEIQEDLLVRLNQAGAAVRATPHGAPVPERLDALFLMPEQPAALVLPEMLAQRPNQGGWFSRLWRRLVHGDDPPTAEEPVLAPAPMLPSIEPLLVETHKPIELEPIELEPIAELAADLEPVQTVLEPLSAALAEPVPMTTAVPERARAERRDGLAIYCFGNFRVYYNDVLIDRWESARGRTILRYLVAHRVSTVPKEQLADMFWPDSEPELARRSLHQAIYCLRQTFKRFASDQQIVRFADDRYQLNPDVTIWVDAEQFGQAIEQARTQYLAGNIEQAMRCYAVAIDLYSAPFLTEDRYEEWTDEPRRTYQAMYLEALHRLARYHFERGEHPTAILLCQRGLAVESCDEEAHQMLMACYMGQGLRHLAVRQFQICTNALKTELGLEPSEELETFYRRTVAAA